ncbi:hypothetical protein ZOSMA_121G00190 [Zostera marina]|uniref:Uncharacterized protein n=1 Tax=Zostera marina TaxID=29655 RepID=A0A0K9Q319_ZOSMR|nr:hypothetical protein ZOSMA_121G00190 [Zostera marina]
MGSWLISFSTTSLHDFSSVQFSFSSVQFSKVGMSMMEKQGTCITPIRTCSLCWFRGMLFVCHFSPS